MTKTIGGKMEEIRRDELQTQKKLILQLEMTEQKKSPVHNDICLDLASL